MLTISVSPRVAAQISSIGDKKVGKKAVKSAHVEVHRTTCRVLGKRSVAGMATAIKMVNERTSLVYLL